MCVRIRSVNTQDNSIKVKVFFLLLLRLFFINIFGVCHTKETSQHYGKCNEEKDESNWTKPLEKYFLYYNCELWLGRRVTVYILINLPVFLHPHTKTFMYYNKQNVNVNIADRRFILWKSFCLCIDSRKVSPLNLPA